MLASVGASKLRIPQHQIVSILEGMGGGLTTGTGSGIGGASASSSSSSFPQRGSPPGSEGGILQGLAQSMELDAALFPKGRWDGQGVMAPYPLTTSVERKRALAAAMSDTVWVYDFPEILRRALERVWTRFESERARSGHHVARPAQVLKSVELVLRRAEGASPDSGESIVDMAGWEIAESSRPPGLNDIGMVAWRMELWTPEYPDPAHGRELIVIANDITHKAGSFGTREDALFALATELARADGIPRIYLAANSGARIGLAEEVKHRFNVAWVDPADPLKGFRYLYLREADAALPSMPAPTLLD
jgi:hypothetical protein